MVETAETDAAIAEAEAEFEHDGQLFDACEALAALRRKHTTTGGKLYGDISDK